MRSIPLFYAVSETEILLSDNSRWVADQAGGVSLDRFSAGEFLLTGYVTGRHTLSESVSQLRAGEAIAFSNRNEEALVETRRYYEFKPRPGTAKSEELSHKLDSVAENAIQRLIRFADGRPIVVPLSGGLDSRLIALTLKRLGYKAVITFTYGKPGNSESLISEKVAEALGFEWNFIPYSEKEWQKWYSSDRMRSYIDFAGHLTSEALIQDWPAIDRLINLGIIGKDSVVVPGHTGDFLSGAHLPHELTGPLRLLQPDLWRVICRHHYHLTTFHGAAEKVGLTPETLRSELLKRFRTVLGIDSPQTESEPLELYNCWEWQERQAKFIINSVRAYEFFGLSWWLPWWDTEFLAFWEKIPLEFLKGRQLYRGYVKTIENSMKVSVPEFVFPSRKFAEVLDGLSTILWPSVFDSMREQFRRSTSHTRLLKHSYGSNPLAVNGVIDFENFKNILRNGGNVNTILTTLQFERLIAIENEKLAAGSVKLITRKVNSPLLMATVRHIGTGGFIVIKCVCRAGENLVLRR